MQKQIELIICQGLPGSGKSTWSRAWVDESPKTRIRVNRDDIRRLLGPYWIPSRETLVTQIERTTMLQALMAGYSVVSDNTNLNEKTLKSFDTLIEVASSKDLVVTKTIKSFLDVPIEECIKRDSQRQGTEKVGEIVIRKMYKQIKSRYE